MPRSLADPLGLGGFGAMVVDEANKQVFVSGGRGTTGIAVFAYDGRLKRTIAGFAGPLGMAVEGSNLFVANYDGRTIDVLDTSSLKVVDTYELGDLSRPSDIVVLNDVVWFVAGECGGTQHQVIAYLDLETSLSGVAVSDGNNAQLRCHHITASPARPDTLYAWDTELPDLHKYLVREGTLLLPPSLEHQTRQILPATLSDLEPAPAGDRLAAVSGYSSKMLELDTNLTTLNEYVLDEYSVRAMAAAYRPDGERIAVGEGEWDGDINLFTPGTPREFAHVLFGRAIARDGLEYSPDGSRLFVVSTDTDGKPPFHFDSISGTKVDTRLTLVGNREWVSYGGRVRLTARLAAGRRSTPVKFYARFSGKRVLIGKSNLDANGKAMLRFRPARNMEIEAVWTGDEAYRPATSPWRWPMMVGIRLVGKITGHYDKRGLYKFARAGSDVAFVVAAFPPHPGKYMEFAVYRKLSGDWYDWGVAVVRMNKYGAGVKLGSLDPGTYYVQGFVEEDRDHSAGGTLAAHLKVTN